MIIATLMLAPSVFRPGMPEWLKCGAAGVLFVNVSISGTLTAYAAPPLLYGGRPRSRTGQLHAGTGMRASRGLLRSRVQEADAGAGRRRPGKCGGHHVQPERPPRPASQGHRPGREARDGAAEAATARRLGIDPDYAADICRQVAAGCLDIEVKVEDGDQAGDSLLASIRTIRRTLAGNMAK